MADNRHDDLDARDGIAFTAASERMARNVASVAAIPWEELPDGPARCCLLDMAYAGGDAGAFRAANGSWWVRIGNRVEPCAAWAARFSV